MSEEQRSWEKNRRAGGLCSRLQQQLLKEGFLEEEAWEPCSTGGGGLSCGNLVPTENREGLRRGARIEHKGPSRGRVGLGALLEPPHLPPPSCLLSTSLHHFSSSNSFPEQLPGSWTWKAGQIPMRSSPHAPPAFSGPWTRELTVQRTRRRPVVPARGSTTDLLSPFLGVGDPAKTGRGFCLKVSQGCTRASAGTVAHAQAPPGGSRLTRGCWQDSVPRFLMNY